MGIKKEIWLPLKEAISLLHKEGIKISDNGLITQSLRYGFARKSDDGIHWEYQKGGLLNYISHRQKIPWAGWISLEEASKKYAIPLTSLYYAIRAGKLLSENFWSKGAKKGVKHVQEKDVRELFK